MKLTYRPEIDGLRAVAIIFIILSHFKQLNFISGGVNIFFVISGYLITHVFLNQKLDISKFYRTRFLKLYPNIFIISLITLILFFFIGDFAQWSLITRSFMSTIIGLFNFYLIKVGNIYGQEDYINPFLPFWAFCVIVQFYIIYPIILKIIFFTKRKFNFNDNFIIISLSTISIVSFLFYYYFRDNNFFSFYSPLSRFWQFIVGSCLYFLFQFKKKLYFKNLTIYFAVVLIIIWQLNFEWFYAWRKVQVLLTISTLLFLYSTNTNFFNKILSIKPLTSLGKVSFELYLIHMAVIYFISLWFGQGVVVLSLILLAIISFLFIKFFNKYLLQKIIFIFSNRIIIFFSLFLILINLSTYFYDKNFLLNKEIQFKNAFSSINYIEKLNLSLKNKYKDSFKSTTELVIGNNGNHCHNISNEKLFKECLFINIDNEKNFFLIGGSQISSLSHNLKQRLENFNYAHFTASDFVYLPNFHKINIETDKKDENFTERNKLIRNTLLSVNKKSIILIGARYHPYLSQFDFNNKENKLQHNKQNYKFENIRDINKRWTNDFKNFIEELLTNKNISVILVYPIPEVDFDPQVRFKNYKFFAKKETDVSFNIFKENTKLSFELLDTIKGDNIYRVYSHTLFCNTIIKDRCVTHDEKNIFYSDYIHPSLKGTEMINDLIMEKIEKIEVKSN
jgi:peptidoglycan/LPS O-acetylase OafA/YrhL